jgi:hypothetical protein
MTKLLPDFSFQLHSNFCSRAPINNGHPIHPHVLSDNTCLEFMLSLRIWLNPSSAIRVPWCSSHGSPQISRFWVHSVSLRDCCYLHCGLNSRIIQKYPQSVFPSARLNKLVRICNHYRSTRMNHSEVIFPWCTKIEQAHLTAILIVSLTHEKGIFSRKKSRLNIQMIDAYIFNLISYSMT